MAPELRNKVEDLPQRVRVAVGDAVLETRKGRRVVHAEVVVPDALHARLLPDQQAPVPDRHRPRSVHAGELRRIGTIHSNPERTSVLHVSV